MGKIGLETHVNCFGVGVGPANLSLASLLNNSAANLSNLFVDKKEEFGWHDDQMIPSATLQVSMLKDLVTLSDPTNPFSFLAYLFEQGRIYHFLNAQFDSVPRQEFRNYLSWASRKNENVAFGEEVISIEFRESFIIHTSKRSISADNVVVGVGSTPWVPPQMRPGLSATQFHVSEFLSRAESLAGQDVVVVGGGQSGAEAFYDLISRPLDQLPGRVSWVSRRSNFLPLDDSPFTNDYYMPGYSEYFSSLTPGVRESFIAENILSSDGISESTLRSIYRQMYTNRFVNDLPCVAKLYPNRNVTRVGSRGDRWEVMMNHNREQCDTESLPADVVIWATGFRPAPMEFLAPIAQRFEMEGKEIRIDQDFAVQWDGPPRCKLFLQSGTRQQRGLADPNLSLNAWRSQRILDRMSGTRSPRQLDSFVDWSGSRRTDESLVVQTIGR